jgi:hypothetical protein
MANKPSIRNRRVCENGHVYYKSSDCPVCPVCEKDRASTGNFLSKLSAPARRALEGACITSLKLLSKYSEKEILKLHGMGPSSIPRLRDALKKSGLNFKEPNH